MSKKTESQPESGPSPIGEISQEPSALEAFLDANQKKLILVGILAILCLIGYVIYDGLRKLAASDAAGEVAAARTVPELDAVSKSRAGTNAGGSALIFKSQRLWQDQQQQEAIDTLQSFVNDYPEHPAIGSAYASIGSYHQQMGKLDEAKAAYEKSAETTTAASSLALLSLGDLARSAGDHDAAEAFYKRITTEYEDSHFQAKTWARQRLELIGVDAPTEKAPELPTPAPATAPAVTTDPVIIPGIPANPANPDSETETPETEKASQTEPETESGELPPLELPEESSPTGLPEKPENPSSPASE